MNHQELLQSNGKIAIDVSDCLLPFKTDDAFNFLYDCVIT